MRNAYDFYNAQTETERMVIEDCFRMLFGLWYEPINEDNDFAILPKTYRVNQTVAEKLGANTDKVVELLFDSTKTEASKRAVLDTIYGMDDDDITKLMEGLRNAY